MVDPGHVITRADDRGAGVLAADGSGVLGAGDLGAGDLGAGESEGLVAHLLGGCSVRLGGVAVDLRSSSRTRRLLAYFLLHGDRMVAREILMDRFWPELSPEAARNNLSVGLARLRAALGAARPGATVERCGDLYGLAVGAVRTDVAGFEAEFAGARAHLRAGRIPEALDALQSAVAGYGGDLLAEDPYVEWVAPYRENLRLAVGEARRSLALLHHDLGHHAAAVATGREALLAEPCDESVHRCMISSFARMGQRHLALRQFEACRTVLAREFGVTPEPATVELIRTVSAGAGSQPADRVILRRTA